MRRLEERIGLEVGGEDRFGDWRSGLVWRLREEDWRLDERIGGWMRGLVWRFKELVWRMEERIGLEVEERIGGYIWFGFEERFGLEME